MSLPIDAYFCKKEGFQILANNGGILITKAEMLLVLQQYMVATGLVGGAYTNWQIKATGDCTWKNEKKFFREALWDIYSRNKIEAAEAGLSANAAPTVDGVTPHDFLDKYEESFDHLAMSATEKQATLDTVIESNQKLVETNAKLVKEVLTLTEMLEAEKKKRTNNNTSNNNNKNNNNNRNNNCNNNNKNWHNNSPRYWADLDVYCWTCGLKVEKDHNSVTCNTRAPGHKASATRQSTMGGNQCNAGFRNLPNGKLRCCPEESNNEEINIINQIDKHIPIKYEWKNLNHLEKWTALLD